MSNESNPSTAMVLSPQSFMELLQRAASDPNVDVAKMQALADLGLKLQAARAEAEFKSEFSGMQAKLPIVMEHGVADFGGTDKRPYALYEDMVEVTQPILAEHGFSINFRTKNDTDKEVTVVGVLSHAGGHSVEASLKFPADTGGKKNPVQALASAISYAERHLRKALLGLATRHEDDDGRGGDVERGPAITEQQIVVIEELLAKSKADREAFMSWLRREIDANGIDEIPAKSFERVRKVLLAKVAPMEAAKEELRARQESKAEAPKPTTREPGSDDAPCDHSYLKTLTTKGTGPVTCSCGVGFSVDELRDFQLGGK